MKSASAERTTCSSLFWVVLAPARERGAANDPPPAAPRWRLQQRGGDSKETSTLPRSAAATAMSISKHDDGQPQGKPKTTVVRGGGRHPAASVETLTSKTTPITSTVGAD